MIILVIELVGIFVAHRIIINKIWDIAEKRFKELETKKGE